MAPSRRVFLEVFRLKEAIAVGTTASYALINHETQTNTTPKVLFMTQIGRLTHWGMNEMNEMNELTKWGERNERINEMTKFLSSFISFISFVLRSKYVEGGLANLVQSARPELLAYNSNQ